MGKAGASVRTAKGICAAGATFARRRRRTFPGARCLLSKSYGFNATPLRHLPVDDAGRNRAALRMSCRKSTMACRKDDVNQGVGGRRAITTSRRCDRDIQALHGVFALAVPPPRRQFRPRPRSSPRASHAGVFASCTCLSRAWKQHSSVGAAKACDRRLDAAAKRFPQHHGGGAPLLGPQHARKQADCSDGTLPSLGSRDPRAAAEPGCWVALATHSPGLCFLMAMT